MQLLTELLQINDDLKWQALFEDLGNLKQLELGPMVNAFKQTYNQWHSKNSGEHTSAHQNKIQKHLVGKDSEAVDAGEIKNWAALKRAYKKHADVDPQAMILKVKGKPVALMIGSDYSLSSVNNSVGLAWDLSKVADGDDLKALTKGLNTSTGRWNDAVGSSEKMGASERSKSVSKHSEYDQKYHGKSDETILNKYSGFVQSIRNIVPFINNLGAHFGKDLTGAIITADKVRVGKRLQRNANPPATEKDLSLFKDDIKKRLAKYKNSKVDSAEDANDFVNKIFSGGMQKVKFAGHTYHAVPPTEYKGSNQEGGGHKNQRSFYDSTMNSLFSGKPVTIKFEADRAESDYSTVYLTVKLVKGALVPVKMQYDEKDEGEKYGKSKTVTF